MSGQQAIVRGLPATVLHVYPDGTAYVRWDGGSQGTVPLADVTPLEDKDYPRSRVEHT